MKFIELFNVASHRKYISRFSNPFAEYTLIAISVASLVAILMTSYNYVVTGSFSEFGMAASLTLTWCLFIPNITAYVCVFDADNK